MRWIILLALLFVLTACETAEESKETIEKPECVVDSDCRAGGCSGELCMTVDNAVHTSSICMYQEKYECFKLTSCGCVEGKCDWAVNEEYFNCLEEYQ